MNLAQALQQDGVYASMANELGVDEGQVRSGAQALLPALVAGLGQSGASGGGLTSILGGLGGGGLLDAVLGKAPTPTQPGNDILGQIFGNKDVSRSVAEEAAGSTGLEPSLLKKMLPILAMAVVGYMLRQRGGSENRSGGIGGGVLGGVLGSVLSNVLKV